MLATTWYVFGVGTTYEYPDDFQHYFVYWVGPCMAAIAASIIYVIYGTLVVAGRDICMIAYCIPKSYFAAAVFSFFLFFLHLDHTSWRHHFRHATSHWTDQEAQGDVEKEQQKEGLEYNLFPMLVLDVRRIRSFRLDFTTVVS
jgi:hypothetical protein